MSVLVSVIIPTFNAEKTVAKAIESILSQEETSYEILVYDAKSSDRTMQVLEPFRSKISVLVSEKDKGIADAWNKAIQKARGEWIYFLGADDAFWDKSVFKKFRGIAESFPPQNLPKVIYGQVAQLDAAGKIVRVVGEPWEKVSRRYEQISCLPHQGMFHHRSIFKEFGVFDLSYRVVSDYALLNRVFKKYPPHHVPNFIVTGFSLGGLSTNLDFRLKTLREIARVHQAMGDSSLKPILTWNIVKTKLRLFLRRIF